MAVQQEPMPPGMTRPQSVQEALQDLAAANGDAVAVAGATWVMRGTLRHERQPARFVALSRIQDFGRLDTNEAELLIGPLATHDVLARTLPQTTALRVLREAAGRSANPGVRCIATIGGNISTSAFAASDFAPALLSLDARIEITDAEGSRELSIERFLASRATFAQPWLVTRIIVPLTERRSAHERLPMRQAGDYPCAIVSVSVALDGAGLIRDIRIGIGAVEAVARRWHGLEQALAGRLPAPDQAEQVARDLIKDFTGREAVDAPGWYRTSVLPVLVRRAFATIQADLTGSPQ
ncbi:FAD binding domain-containing protein [Rhizobium sp. LjRoot254]|uniref:FAD binding domain-containing protein n=1 Tax=Rhizobium sp. LjRoot254 TaxID=3342297 RepID=UPI003ECD4197